MSGISDFLIRLSSFIPRHERVAFLQSVVETCGSIYKASKELGISRAQIYRYLARSPRRNYPSDEVMARILAASLRLRPAWTRDRLRFLAKSFSDMVRYL